MLSTKFTCLLFPVCVLASACGDDGSTHDDHDPSCLEDTRDEEYVAGISKTGSAGYVIAIADSNPAPPAKGDNIWTVEVKDSGDAPVTGMTLESAPFMPDHGHGTPIVALVTETGNGVYTVNPVNLFMPGYWETTITLVDPGATDSPDDDVDLDSVVFKFCVEG